MNLENEFTIDRPVDEVWAGLVDVEEVAPCVPGFSLKESDGDEFRGKMKVKIGAINMTYRATIKFTERDDDSHRIVISAKGQEMGGQGSVDSTVVAELTEVATGTQIRMDTDVAITGRVAQFGRGIIADVSDRLVKQFVKSFEAKLEQRSAPAAAPQPPPVENEPLNIGAVAAWPVARRVLPPVAGLLALALLIWLVAR